MPSFGSETGNVLYLIVCAAPPARDTPELVKQLRSDGWDVCVIATPASLRWIDTDELTTLTGHVVRSEYRGPDEEEFIPRGDAILLAPATFNTVNKWVAGISDSLALGLLNEALGSELPVLAVPVINDALMAHPAVGRSFEVLEAAGVELSPRRSIDPIVLATNLIDLMARHDDQRARQRH
jgi:phosphopantothenoylcysteine decarboxylase